MAKFKLFGNRKEPRCETCANGKASADGVTVLCRHGGAVPADHHCRRYVYDPLRRTPRRPVAPPPLEEAAFALDDPPQMPAPAVADSYHDRMMNELRSYLDETDAPDVTTILSILHASPNDDVSDLLEEAASLAVGGEPSVAADDTFRADDSADIFDDLARLGKAPDAAAKAAVDGSDLRFAQADTDESFEAPLDDDSLMFVPAQAVDEEPPLYADDLVLVSDGELPDEDADYTDAVVPDDALTLLSDDETDAEYDAVLPLPDDAIRLPEEDDTDE